MEEFVNFLYVGIGEESIKSTQEGDKTGGHMKNQKKEKDILL